MRSSKALAGGVNGVLAVLALTSVAHALNHAYGALMPLIYPIVIDELHLSYTDIGALVGLTNAAGGLVQFSYGFLTRYVRRKVLLGLGQLGSALSLLLTAAASTYGLFFLGNLAARLSQSPQHPVGSALLSDRFPPASRGMALSLHQVGGNIGTLVVPLLAAVLLPALGWRLTLTLFAVPTGAVAVALMAFLVEARQQDGTARHGGIATGQVVRSLLQSRTLVLIMLASVIAAGGRGLGALNTYVPLYLGRDLKATAPVVSLLYTLLLVGGVFGPVVLGRLSDRSGRKAVLYGIYGAGTLLLLGFVGVGNASVLLLGLFLLGVGITSSSDSTLLQVFLADTTTPAERDLVFGMYFTIAYGVGSLWPTLVGYMADNFGMTSAFAVMAATYAVAGLCLVPARETKRA